MPQQKTPIEITSFSKGLVTEVNPLSFPPDASLDEQNFILNRDGTRDRRLGMDYETNYVLRNSNVAYSELPNLDIGLYRWENIASVPEQTAVVIWIGNRLYFNDLTNESISSETFSGLLTLENFPPTAKLSMTSIDGRLIVACGQEEVAVVSYVNNTMEVKYLRLLVRDTFGVEDLYSNSDTNFQEIDLRDSNNVQFRPKFKTDTHVYNLRNQTWGSPKRSHIEYAQSYDPIENFHTAAYYENDSYEDIKPVDGVQKYTLGDKGVLPSNSDITHYGMAPDSDDDPPTDNFYARTLFDVPLGNTEAPRGFFIIDALRRGTSRLEAYEAMMNRNPKNYTTNNKYGLSVDINSLPLDLTPNGAATVEEYAGRVWYAGFSGDVVDGDAYSPKLSSYVLFSKLVESATDINKCYQSGDPTSEETPDIVGTDGGFVRISGAYNIRKLVNLGSGLAVLAQNGIWVVLGETEDAGFTASGFQVIKVSDYSLLSPRSAVEVDNGLVYWSEDGIYSLSKNEVGAFKASNITQNTIQKYYDSIDISDKEKATGSFDPYERKIRWLFGENKELIFDVNMGAFTKNTIEPSLAKLVAPVETPSFSVGTITEDVYSAGEFVEAGGELVQVTTSIRNSGFRSTKYLTIVDNGGIIYYTFSLYNNQKFKDWESVDGTGVDAEAFLLTGYMNGGDNQRSKQVPYLTIHMFQTETVLGEDFELQNQSSCKVTSQWDWTNNVNSNRWGREFEAYRLKRVYFTEAGDFDNGHYLVTTKNKLRGSGKALSLRFKTEPERDCKLIGWSMLVGTKNNV